MSQSSGKKQLQLGTCQPKQATHFGSNTQPNPPKKPPNARLTALELCRAATAQTHCNSHISPLPGVSLPLTRGATHTWLHSHTWLHPHTWCDTHSPRHDYGPIVSNRSDELEASIMVQLRTPKACGLMCQGVQRPSVQL